MFRRGEKMVKDSRGKTLPVKKSAKAKKVEAKAKAAKDAAKKTNVGGNAKANELIKARKAAQAAKRGVNSKVSTKVRTNVHFRRPKTLSLLRNPKYQRKSTVHRPRMDRYTVIKYPMCTESAMRQIEEYNTLTFIVDLKATKRNIRNAVKEMYELDNLVSVNTLIRPDGQKKAYVRLAPDQEALEIANTIGII